MYNSDKGVVKHTGRGITYLEPHETTRKLADLLTQVSLTFQLDKLFLVFYLLFIVYNLFNHTLKGWFGSTCE